LWSLAVVEGGGDSGCASSPRRSDTSVCVFYSSQSVFSSYFPFPTPISSSGLCFPRQLSAPFFPSFSPSVLFSALSPVASWQSAAVRCAVTVESRHGGWLRVLFFYFSVLFWVSPLLMILSPLSLGLPVNISPWFFSFYGFGPFSSLFLFLSEKLLLPSFRSLLSLSKKKTVGLSLSRFPSSFFFKTKSFQLSFFFSPPLVSVLHSLCIYRQRE
jgi:hypothetical protein